MGKLRSFRVDAHNADAVGQLRRPWEHHAAGTALGSSLPSDVGRFLPIVDMLRNGRLRTVRIDVDHVIHDFSVSPHADEPLGLITIPLRAIAFQSQTEQLAEVLAPSRKVRTPQGMVVGNADPGKPAGKCHRKHTAQARHKRAGKVEMVR